MPQTDHEKARLLAAERCSPIRWAADTRVKLGRLECLAEEDMLLMNHLVKRLESGFGTHSTGSQSG